MKTCPVCDTEYPAPHTTCPTDGAMLIGSHELAPGSLVRGKYRIVRKLGEGGMGIVYLADDILLGVRVALKFLAGELGKDPRFTKRFRAEARAAYQLRHPNVVEVTNLDQAEDGTLFIAMEYVEGPSLRAELDKARGGFAVPRALEILRGIASGLAAAHAQGTVHRDIKPENILLFRTTDGQERPKILDFGIAAVAESVTRNTRTRGFLLTPDYAAPEQWLEVPADEMDGRTDLYALGCVLYEMFTGSPPFDAHNTAGWMKQHLEKSPQPPSGLRPELADWQGLDALTLRLLAKDRDHRPMDAPELLSLLDAVRFAPANQRSRTITEDARKRAETLIEKAIIQPITAPKDTETQLLDPGIPEPEPRPRRFPGWAWGALAIVTVAASLFALRIFTSQSKPTQTQAPATQPTSQREPVTPQMGQITSPKVSNQSPGASSQAKPAQVENPKPPAPVSETVAQRKSAPVKNPTQTISQPETAAQAKPTPAESPKPSVQEPRVTEVEHQAEMLNNQKRFAEAAPLYDQACRGGNPGACYRLGMMYKRGEGVTKDDSRALSLFSKACDTGNLDGCNDLGIMYHEGTGAAKDDSRAVTLFSRACDAGMAMGCNNLGIMYGSGAGVAKDYARARDLLAKACDGGFAVSCGKLGRMYVNDLGAGWNPSRTLPLISKGCDAGDQESCNVLGIIYENGYQVAKDAPRALALYTKGCDAGGAMVCRNLGWLYRDGAPGVPKDIGKGNQILSKSCAMGTQLACSEIKELQ